MGRATAIRKALFGWGEMHTSAKSLAQELYNSWIGILLFHSFWFCVFFFLFCFFLIQMALCGMIYRRVSYYSHVSYGILLFTIGNNPFLTSWVKWTALLKNVDCLWLHYGSCAHDHADTYSLLLILSNLSKEFWGSLSCKM